MVSRYKIYQLAKSDYLKLLPILGLAFYMAFIPHHNYPYPVHLDEWTHLACSNQIMNQGSVIGLINPFGRGAPTPNQLLEIGFHVFWLIFYQISGLSWLTIFKYFPGIIFIITVLSVYILARRQGFGWEAAFFTCLIPTTVGILGPGFLVPVAMGLPFIALSLFIVFNFSKWWSYAVLFVFMTFLLSQHAATAVGLVIILVPYILLNLKGNFKKSLGIMLAVATSFLAALIALPQLWDMLVVPEAKALFVPQFVSPSIYVPQVITTYGYLPLLLGLLGVFSLAMRRGKRNYGLILGLLALLLMLATFFSLHYGSNWMYYRGLLYMMLMMSIATGAGLLEVKNLRIPERFMIRLKVPPVMQNVGYILCLILIGLTLYIAIPTRQNINYYHMIDSEDYQAFVWIRDNIDSSYERAILDPWKGTAFTAISGKYVYTWIGERPMPSDERAYKFLGEGSSDTTFLRENRISIIYTRGEVHNPNLNEVRKYVYLLKEAENQ